MSSPLHGAAYIVAARRSALGRIGGLHRARRLEDLAAPVIVAVLTDAGIDPAEVEEIVVGNASQGANPARMIALAAGLPETASALTIDRQGSSGLDAILHAARSVALGESDVIVAGGAESLSTAPWRIARPRSIYQTPHFMALEPTSEVPTEVPYSLEASELLAKRLGISRQAQDAFALKSHLRAEAAREARRFVGEIVPLRANRDEARDESAVAPSLEDIEAETTYWAPNGTLTPANTSQPHDGAAFVAVVSEAVWQRLGQPPALRLVASAARGVASADEAGAPIAAMQKLYGRLNGFDRSAITSIELGETSAAQALACINELGVDESLVNAEGGAVVRGHPLGASGAVLVVRLFSRLVRGNKNGRSGFGAVTQGASGGLGLAALFEAV
ncbi:MAG: thiolase family protein [Hyphomicrobiaceae bacterium]